jgi:hypothetical protein
MATTNGSDGKKTTAKRLTANFQDCLCKSKEKGVHY